MTNPSPGDQSFDVLDNIPLVVRRRLLRNNAEALTSPNLGVKGGHHDGSQQESLPTVKDIESQKNSILPPLEADQSLEMWSGDPYEVPSVVRRELLCLAKERSISCYAANAKPFSTSENSQTSMSIDNVVRKERDDHGMQKLLPEMKDDESIQMSSLSVNKCESGSDKWSSDLDHVPLKLRQLMLLEAEASSFRLNLSDVKKDDRDYSLQGHSIDPAQGLTQFSGQEMHPADGSSVKSQLGESSTRVKVEPVDGDMGVLDTSDSRNSDLLPIKREPQTCDKPRDDNEDHLVLQHRRKLLASGRDSELQTSRSNICSTKTERSPTECNIVPESAYPISIRHPRGKRKSTTDSVEKAMEEDAPGLLQALIEKGVSVEEIRLYGFRESDEALEESFGEESFTDSESTAKWSSERQPFIKFAPIRLAKGSKRSYCLPCLLALIDQARYLHFRRWPAEWGWCRDLQSFIFVFQRHNRIVLERPEYGYATYFFELHGSLPVDWQIKRLVTAMNLISCSRISLIENKALLVGEDISESQARMLTEFGWTPGIGLGTMLHYYDRVYHDRKNEKDSSEWKSKIADMLVDGLQGGTLVSTSIVDNVKVENEDDNDP